ncbi:MAG: PQQ-dependent sugar dehydrogenase [Paracoccaceae bacterium]
MRLGLICIVFYLNALAVNAADVLTSQGNVSINRIMGGLDQPWGLAFLPGGGFLVTERSGQLIHVDQGGSVTRIRGVPRVADQGQGGLLDVMVPQDFAQSRTIFLSFAKKSGRDRGTALAVGTLNDAGSKLSNVKLIFEMSSGGDGDSHFGGRIVERRDGTIFLTIGERGKRRAAQDLSRHNGSIIRINRDGSIPADNPFVDNAGARPEIWTYGHRNPQGAALDLNGNLWVDEHGAKGGDEVNLIIPGKNYGWPVIAYGRHYSGAKIGEGTHKSGMEQPRHFWDPSIAPSGLMIYSGKLWPEWRGDFFIGSLKFDYISRLDPKSGWAEENIASDETARVRDVREAPDGSIWFLSAREGAIYRITPAE